MTLLFDQNLSFRIIKRIEDIFPGSISVKEMGFDRPSDIEIWEFAKSNHCSIVTFDSDFIDISNLKGFPPKIIWLRLGNTSTVNIADKLRSEKDRIIEFLMKSDNAFLEIT